MVRPLGMRRFLALVLALFLVSPVALTAKKQMSNLRIVVQDAEDNPVPRASVIVRVLKGKKHKKVGRSYQLRTSQQGTAPLPPLKQGFVLIQVIASGYQTFGDTIELREPEQTIKVTLKPPQDQHSVHK